MSSNVSLLSGNMNKRLVLATQKCIYFGISKEFGTKYPPRCFQTFLSKKKLQMQKRKKKKTKKTKKKNSAFISVFRLGWPASPQSPGAT